MIRVNLLPQKRRKPSGSSELWLVITLVAVSPEVL